MPAFKPGGSVSIYNDPNVLICFNEIGMDVIGLILKYLPKNDCAGLDYPTLTCFYGFYPSKGFSASEGI
jgi:hypothetical protein